MKRDQSLLFTAVPEEGSDNSATVEQPFIPTTKKTRPKFLNLKSISVETNSEMKSTKAGPGTPFCGQRSVCSTPMTELKKFVHNNPLLICKNKDITENNKPPIPTPPKTEIACKTNHLLENAAPYLNITSNCQTKKSHSSLLDLTDIKNSIMKNSTQYFNNKMKVFVEIDSPIKKRKVIRSRSVVDPTFPVEKQDGAAISRTFYQRCIDEDLKLVQKECFKKDIVSKKKVCKETNNFIEETKLEVNKDNKKGVSDRINKEHRKSLTLPLKSLATESNEDVKNRRYSMGVQLTPLLSKLSTLAFEERSSGFCSRDTTPCDYRGLTPTRANFSSFAFSKIKSHKEVKVNKPSGDALQKCVLFVCGQQDVVLMILLREEACAEPTVIKTLVSGKSY